MSFLQEICSTAWHGTHQKGSGSASIWNTALPAVISQIQGWASVPAGHGHALHLQVSLKNMSEVSQWLLHRSKRFPAQIFFAWLNLWFSSDIMYGQKATLQPTLRNGGQPQRRTECSGRLTLSLTWWWGGTVQNMTADLWDSAGTKWLTLWSLMHR